jgi:hypothetical protein
VRKDMFEVIIERPRHGGGWTKRKRQDERTDRAWGRAPTSLGMGRGRGSKSLNENLAPLRRFLRRRTGKPWSKVRSEICQVISTSSAVQKHVMDHVRDLVEENPVMIDGRPHDPAAYGGSYRPLRAHARWPHFYVCPKTGLLREVRPAAPRAKSSPMLT